MKTFFTKRGKRGKKGALAFVYTYEGAHKLNRHESKICQKCGKEFLPTKEGGQKRCLDCGPRFSIELQKSYLLAQPHLDSPQLAARPRLNLFLAQRGRSLIEPHNTILPLRLGGEPPKDRTAYTREYNKGRKDKQAAYYRVYQPAHPEQAKIQCAKRRGMKFNELNSFFPNSDAHHINLLDVIYIPIKLHKSIRHCLKTGKNMEKINALAGAYLTEDWT